ncbi:MAG: protein-L-isoaspartate O-methyltransferase [Crocinitomicaceae bacterium]|nr:protein-L-isoaspartate O-methyltransferase [Crocinitomicaceae bacterium]
MRLKLVEELQKMGISDQKVLDAIKKIPRHFFIDSTFEKHAYTNKAFPIASGQTISQPHTVANQTELLKCKTGDTVLEIGTGSGYQCAVLCEMGMKVHSIERQKELFDSAGPLLRELGYKPFLYYGDGYKGKEVFAPFDGVIVTCGAPFIPDALIDQLKVGGRLVIPVGPEGKQRMLTIDKVAEGELVEKNHGDAAFVPMLESRARD